MSDGAPPPERSSAFAAFRYRNFRWMWTASLLSSTGTWVQNVAVPFVVFQITGSGAWLGVAGFLAYIPMVVTGPLAGSIADRFHRRTVLMVTGTIQAAFAFLLWVVWTSGERRIGVILALVTLGSFANGLNIASWQAFVTELVPRDLLLNAVTLNSAQFNAARAFGPAVGGIVLALVGPGWSFFINGVTFLAIVGALVVVHVPRTVREVPPGRPRPLAEMWQAIRYVRTERGIVTALVVVFSLGFLGGPLFNLLVVFADRVYGVGNGAYGVLAGCLGTGAILTAPLIAGRGSALPRSRLVVIAMSVYGVALVALGLSPVYLMGAAALLVAGAGYLGISSTLNTTVQIQVTEQMRGKVLALYVMTLTLAVPLGSLLQGWLVDVIGVQVTVAAAGAAFLGIMLLLRFGLRLFTAMDGSADEAGPGLVEAVAEAESTEAAVDPL